MNITIYHKINEGDLYPPCSVTMHLSDLVKQHFNDIPSSLEQAEEWLTAELQGDTSLSFPPAPKKIPVRMTPAAKYTAIKRDTFPVVLPLDSINRTPVERYYNAIIIWEGYRIVETLLRNADWKSVDQQNIPITIKYPSLLTEFLPYFRYEEMPNPEFGCKTLWFL